MARIYATAADHINFHPYAVLVSPSYSPVLPEAFVLGELEPIYQNPTPAHPVRAMMPIKYLIDIHSTNNTFSVIDPIDVIRIFHSIDAYLYEIKDTIQANPAVKQYAEKVLNLRKDAYKNFVRVLNHNPEWKEAYGGGVTRLLNIFELFAAPDFEKRRRSIDPIEQLRDPPIILNPHNGDALKDQQKTTSWLSVPYSYA